jgi:hypothetical protein
LDKLAPTERLAREWAVFRPQEGLSAVLGLVMQSQPILLVEVAPVYAVLSAA